MEGLSILATPAAAVSAVETVSPLTVLGLGISIVFLGLVCIIILTKVMGWIMQAFTGKEKKEAGSTPAAETIQQAVIPDRAEFVAAVTAAIAEDLGQDVSKIRIHSIRRI